MVASEPQTLPAPVTSGVWVVSVRMAAERYDVAAYLEYHAAERAALAIHPELGCPTWQPWGMRDHETRCLGPCGLAIEQLALDPDRPPPLIRR